MEQTHSWEDNCFLASQEIAHILHNPFLQECATGSCAESDESNSYSSILLLQDPF